jgi:predicted transport protein
MYEEGVFSLDALNVLESAPLTEEAKEEPKLIAKVEEESTPAVESFLIKSTPAVREMYEELREGILALDEAIIEKPTSIYVGYRMSNNFAEVHFQKSGLKVFLRPVDYVDPRGFVKQVSDGYGWKLNRFFQITSADDIGYVMGLIEQSYKDVL